MIKSALILIILLVSSAHAQTTQLTSSLDSAVRAVCPQIDGISIGNPVDKATWVIKFQAGATCQTAAQTALTNFTLQNVITFSTLVSRLTDAEYQSLMQKRAQAIAAGTTTSIFLVKQFDQAMATGVVDLNTAAVQTFKASLVAAGILSQARADAIFQ